MDNNVESDDAEASHRPDCGPFWYLTRGGTIVAMIVLAWRRKGYRHLERTLKPYDRNLFIEVLTPHERDEFVRSGCPPEWFNAVRRAQQSEERQAS